MALLVIDALAEGSEPRHHLLPDVGIWVPQPSVHVGQRHKEIPEFGDPPSSVIEEGSGFRIYEPFFLPPDDELCIPSSRPKPSSASDG